MKYRIIDIHPNDSYHPSKYDLAGPIGALGTFPRGSHHSIEEGYVSGHFNFLDNPSSVGAYFYAVKVEAVTDDEGDVI